jgi:DNA ligase N terminus
VEFAVLAQTFEELEQTSSRLALIELLTRLFRSIERPGEIEQVCYLVQGRVAPFFVALEMGMADEITRSPTHTAGKVGAEPGYALRFPRLVSFRERDKKPEDATTVQELIEMYNSQGKK